MKKTVIILFVALFSSAIFPQQVSNWTTYTDMKNINALKGTGNGVYASTGGGGFFYNGNSNSYTTITRTDGLQGITLTSVTVDNSGKVWFGSTNGIIDIYNPEDNSIESLLDIFLDQDKSFKQINELVFNNDTIFAATEFGLALIDPDNLLFYDTYISFGSLPSNINVNSSFKHDLIYIATNMGLVIQKPGAVNLSAPESWNVFKTEQGLPSDKITRIINYNDSIIVATANGFAYYDGNNFSPFLNSDFGNSSIKDVLIKNDTLFILTGNSIYSYNNGSITEILSSEFNLSKLSYSNTLGILAASNNGIIIFNNSPGNHIFPNGPAANQFPNISVAPNGNFWSASGKDNTGVGFYTFNGEKWTNFNKSNTPELPTNDYYSVHAGPDNTAYIGNWGNGFARVKNNNIEIFTVNNTDMIGFSGNPNFLVITDFATDSKNNTWILNYGSVANETLSMITPDSTWHHFTIPAANDVYYDEFYNLAIDPYDTKWFCSQDNDRRGIYYFNENGTPDDPSDDISGFINSTNGLNESFVQAITVDNRGDIWVGTGTAGVNIITNIESVLQSGVNQLRYFNVFALRNRAINCIAVDPLNRKWVGTNQGLFLLNSDGTNLIEVYDTKNSPLLSDVIVSLAIDKQRGIVYVGTDAGLTSFETVSIQPNENFDELFVYPNPFIIEDGSGKVIIDGLMINSGIKILNISGKLVDEFNAPGGRIAFWDGRNKSGEFVNSGVYIIVAFDEDGNNVASTKIAVLRK